MPGVAVLSASRVIAWGRALREMVEQAASFQEAARSAADHLLKTPWNAGSGAPPCTLVRMSRSACPDDLPDSARDVVIVRTAQGRLPSEPPVGNCSSSYFEVLPCPEGSVLSFGGAVSDSEVFTAAVVLSNPVSEVTAKRFRAIALNLHLGLLAHFPGGTAHCLRETLTGELLSVLEDDLSSTDAELEFARDAVLSREKELREEARIVDTLHQVGRSLAAELELKKVIQLATDAATELTGAAFGSFFYNVIDSLGESYVLYVLSGVPREAFSKFPMPRKTQIFGPTFNGTEIVRLADVTADVRYGRNPPYHGMPEGHLPVRSYLAVPVLTPDGEVLGGFFFGHPEPGVFEAKHERLATGIAAQAAIALDNARLYELQRDAAVQLQRSLLPTIPAVEGLQVLSRYLPAARGVEVGGDWIDLIPLDAERTAFVVGDVMGKGIRAAAVMGQLRTAVRAYAITGLGPAMLMNRMNALIGQIAPAQLVTCVYAVLDRAEGTLRWANAGHLPPALLSRTASVRFLDERLGPPLGVGPADFREQVTRVPPKGSLLLFTDGLVERRDTPIDQGLRNLAEQLATIRGEPEEAAAKLIDQLTGPGDHDDDIAVLYVGFDR
jgi:serine phosphatase RsbU (regulator of sigma subunit)